MCTHLYEDWLSNQDIIKDLSKQKKRNYKLDKQNFKLRKMLEEAHNSLRELGVDIPEEIIQHIPLESPSFRSTPRDEDLFSEKDFPLDFDAEFEMPKKKEYSDFLTVLSKKSD